MNEFSGIGFAAGVVRGTRSFNVDKLGRLTGVNYKQVWTPGENAATCRKGDATGGIIGGFGSQMFAYSFTINPPDDTSVVAKKVVDKARKEAAEKAKRDLLVDCAHGFYGYYDGSNDYYEPGRVMGVIEGYGETVIGTRGFRCMKARIVAIRIPKHVPDRLRTLILRNYQNIPVFDSFRQMVSEFPPDSAGMAVSPDTDPDFWTRAI